MLKARGETPKKETQGSWERHLGEKQRKKGQQKLGYKRIKGQQKKFSYYRTSADETEKRGLRTTSGQQGFNKSRWSRGEERVG